MTVPGLPLAGPVLRHPDMTLRILKGPLNPKTLCLHLHQSPFCDDQTYFQRFSDVISREFPAAEFRPS
jgi:hypothetical protein